MELNEKLDQAYHKDKEVYNKLEKLKENLKKKESYRTQLKRMKEDAETKKQRAIEDKDDVAKKDAEAEIEKVNQELKKTTQEMKKGLELIKKSREKVESYINELNKNPEFKAHMESILEVRYNRKIKKEKQDKEKVEILIDICEKHPQIENNLKGMIRASEEIRKIEEELKELDPIKDKKRIDEINNVEIPTMASKKQLNKSAFINFCSKNNINIDEKFLEDLIEEKRFSHYKIKDKDGNEKDIINLSKSLKNISKGYDKRISTYKKAIEKIPGAVVYEEGETKISKKSSIKVKNTKTETELPAKKFKWWEFGKRFNAWREKRAVKKEQNKQEKQEKESYEKRKETKFRDAYKYEIVQDYLTEIENKLYKEAYKDKKKEKQKEDEENEK